MPTALFSVLIEDLIFLCCQVVHSFPLRCQDFTKIFDLHGDGVIRADEFLDFGRQVFGVDIQVIGVIWFLYCPTEIVIAGSITLYGIQTHSRSTFSLLSQVPFHHWLPSQRRWQGKEMNWRAQWYRGDYFMKAWWWFQSLFWPRKTFRKGSQWMSPSSTQAAATEAVKVLEDSRRIEDGHSWDFARKEPQPASCIQLQAAHVKC